MRTPAAASRRRARPQGAAPAPRRGGAPTAKRSAPACSSPRAAAAAGARRRLAERIATLAAADGRQALLIDGDLAAGGGERPGLVELLRGDGSAAELAFRDGDAPFLRLASGAGDPFETPARHGGDASACAGLRRAYDFVALDGGAMSDNPRIAALAAEADLVLIVAALGEPQAALMREAESALAAGARVDAVALVATPNPCRRRRPRSKPRSQPAQQCCSPSPAGCYGTSATTTMGCRAAR